MAAELRVRPSAVLEKIIEKIISLVAALKQCALEASRYSIKLQNAVISEAYESKCLWVQLSLCSRMRMDG